MHALPFAITRHICHRLPCSILPAFVEVQQEDVVINFDLPGDRENYIHRMGRSGRYGRNGVAINFVTAEDVRQLRDLEQFYHTEVAEMPMNVNDLI